MMHYERTGRRHAHTVRTALLVTGLVGGLSGCDVLSTEVENPNVVGQEDVEKPAAAAALVSGVMFRTTSALGELGVAHGTIADELTWRGSFDNVGALDRGVLTVHDQLYIEPGYEDLATARWLGDEAVRILEGHDANGDLPSRQLLAEAYWLAGVNYLLAAENFEEFAVSDRREPGPIVPRGQLFDTGLDYLAQAATTAQSAGDADLEVRALAYRARGYWSRALWSKLEPGATPAQPLIDDSDANALAAAVLARVPAGWEHAFAFTSSTQQSRLGFEVNSRREVAVEDHVIEQDASLRQSCWPENSSCSHDGIRLMDPVDDIQDPALRREAWTFMGSFVYPIQVGVSARELNLILAEAALLNDDVLGYTARINAVRGLESSLTPYNAAIHAGVDRQELLVHMRRTNLFLQLQRRLLDMYRFGIQAPVWEATGTAVTAPGTVFPIGKSECNSNPVVGAC